MRLTFAVQLSLVTAVLSTGLRPQIPSVESFVPSSGDPFQLSADVRILVDSKEAGVGSPSLLDFAKTFREDLSSVAPFEILLPVQTSFKNTASFLFPAIFLTIDTKKQYKLFNGKPTADGYDLSITRNSITITASAPIGAWWGTRTLLQQVALAAASGSRQIPLPVGQLSDSPGWEVRGFMLDVGRHWFETDFLS